MEVGGQRFGVATGTRCTGGWVGHRAGLDECGKSHPPPGFDPRTSYTDCANTAHHTSLASVVDIQCMYS